MSSRNLLAFFFVFLFLFLFLLIVIKTIKNPKLKNLPPSPWQLPLIGNLHQLAASGSLLHRTLADLSRTHGPIMHLHLGHVPAIVISSPDIAAEVYKLHDVNFSDRPYFFAAKIMSYGSSGVASSQYGPYWKQLRRICMTELLSGNRVESFSSIKEDEVNNLLETLAASRGSAVDVSAVIFSLAYAVIARAAFGKKCEDEERFVSVVEETMKLSAGFSLPDLYPEIEMVEVVSGLRPRFERLHRESDEILEKIIDEHRRKKTSSRDEKDFVDVLLERQAGGELTDDNIKAVILDIFIGGSESSSTVVEWAMSELIKNPKLMKEVQAEVRQVFYDKGIHKLTLLKAVIKETLRLHPPGPLLMPRQCREDCVISGYSIPAKAKVIVNGWAIGRDPKYWTEAHKFDPDRFLDSSIDYKGTDFQFIPFGAGRRICPGISFAQHSIELPLAKLLYHFNWKLAGGERLEDLDMTEDFGLTVRRKKHLFLIPTLYRPIDEIK